MRHLLKLDFWLDVLDAWRNEWEATVEWYRARHYDEPMPEVCPWCGQDIPPDDEAEGPDVALTGCPRSCDVPGVTIELVNATRPREEDLN